VGYRPQSLGGRKKGRGCRRKRGAGRGREALKGRGEASVCLKVLTQINPAGGREGDAPWIKKKGVEGGKEHG